MDSFDDLTMERARKGDMTAWSRIYQSYEGPMYSLALNMVGSAAVAEDMVQDTFIKVMEKIKLFRGDCQFWSWVRRILTNQCIGYLRINKRWVSKQEIEIESLINDFVATSDIDIEHDTSKLLDRLPEQARRVVYLYVIEGMTHKEIGELFGCTSSFSKSLVSRSLANLKKWVKR